MAEKPEQEKKTESWLFRVANRRDSFSYVLMLATVVFVAGAVVGMALVTLL